jgi:hypothetical protein
MKLSITKVGKNIWAWLFWGLGIYLALELGPFLVAARVLNKTTNELVGSYLAFAVPAMIIMPSIWWLRKYEAQGASPKRLARGWCLSMALFGVVTNAAVFYSGVKLHLMDPSDAAGSFVVMVLLSVSILYFGMYHRVLRFISARAAGKPGASFI